MDSIANIRESAWEAFRLPAYAYTLSCNVKEYCRPGINLKESEGNANTKRSSKKMQRKM